MSRHITWIVKPGGSQNTQTRITEVGGSGWSRLANDAIRDVLNDPKSYYVQERGRSVWVGLGVRNEKYYLKTLPDGTPVDNLLSLENRAH